MPARPSAEGAAVVSPPSKLSKYTIEIGVFEAKNRLSTLLDQVEQGAEFVITRHGRAVARLVPVSGTAPQEARRAAMARIRARAAARRAGPFD